MRDHPECVRPSHVAEHIANDPDRFPRHWFTGVLDDDKKLRDKLVDGYLSEHRIMHDWQKTGTQKVSLNPKTDDEEIIARGKKSVAIDEIVSEKCKRCGLMHRYFAGSGAPHLREFEGYFMGGNRLDMKTTPECLQLRVARPVRQSVITTNEVWRCEHCGSVNHLDDTECLTCFPAGEAA